MARAVGNPARPASVEPSTRREAVETAHLSSRTGRLVTLKSYETGVTTVVPPTRAVVNPAVPLWAKPG